MEESTAKVQEHIDEFKDWNIEYDEDDAAAIGIGAGAAAATAFCLRASSERFENTRVHAVIHEFAAESPATAIGLVLTGRASAGPKLTPAALDGLLKRLKSGLTLTLDIPTGFISPLTWFISIALCLTT